MPDPLPDAYSADASASPHGLFPVTQWSMVAGAGNDDSPGALAALERLGRAYWQPLYVFVRQRGMGHEDAADAVQGFFAHLLSRGALAGVQQRQTRFRSFLLTCFQNWLVSAQRRECAAKRGGGTPVVPLEEIGSLSGLPVAEPGDTPESAYDRRWARTIYDRARARLAEEADQRPAPQVLREIQQRLFHPPPGGPAWEEAARLLGMSHEAVRKAAYSLRTRFAALLRLEVCSLVADEAEADEELRYLVRLLSGGPAAA